MQSLLLVQATATGFFFYLCTKQQGFLTELINCKKYLDFFQVVRQPNALLETAVEIAPVGPESLTCQRNTNKMSTKMCEIYATGVRRGDFMRPSPKDLLLWVSKSKRGVEMITRKTGKFHTRTQTEL